MKTKFFLFCVALLGVFAQSTLAQQKLTSSMLNEFKFRNLGAYRAGAWVSAIAVPENPGEKYRYTFFVAGRNGGVWKTINNGTTFYPVFEKYGVTTIGAITVAPSNPDVVWVGTGESYNARSSFAGNGIYKSVDGGETFTNMGLKDSHHIAKIIVDPKNADIVYVAVMGHLYSSNAERGIFKSTDGGKSWEKVLFIDDKTGVIDIVMDPSSSDILFASAYEKTRLPWHFEAGGKNSAVYKTKDSGKSWLKMNNGLPGGELGRIGLTISRSNPKIVYAVVENLNPKDPSKALKTEGMMDASRDNYYDQLKGGEVYRSDNGGGSWRIMNDEKFNVSSKAAYSFNQIFCHPQNPDNLWVISDAMIYAVGYDFLTPYNVYLGLQDHDVWRGPSDSWAGEVGPDDWTVVGSGDGMYCRVDKETGRWVYSTGQFGQQLRLDAWKGTATQIMPRAPEDKPALPLYLDNAAHTLAT